MNSMRTRIVLVASAALATLLAHNSSAHEAPFGTPLAANLELTGRKIVALAETIPAERYDWRPTPEVRSMSEVFMHIVGGNFQLPADFGADPPEGIEIPEAVWDLARQRARWEDEVTTKEEVVGILRRSFDYASESIPALTDLDEQASTWGFPASKRDYLLVLLGHAHEHLGQAITYARSMGIVPPWSQRREPAVADSVATFADGAAHAAIESIDSFGNLVTTFVPDDLAQLGANKGDHLVIEACGGSAEALYGDELFDVRPGSWVIFASPSGHLTLAVSYGSAAESLGCEGSGPIGLRPAR